MQSAYMSISSQSSPSLYSAWNNDRCTFNVYSESSSTTYQYNLCPLLTGNDGAKKIQVIKDEDTPPTHTRHVYDIAMMDTDGLEWDGTLPSSLQCPKGTWICLTVINSRPDHPSEPSRILQVIPISTVEKSNPKASYQGNQLQVAFHGGRYMGKKNKALFYFTCEHDQEISTPKLLWSFNGTHSFSWASKYGCPVDLQASTIHATPTAPPNSDPDPEPSDRPPQESEDSENPEEIPVNKSVRAAPIASVAIVLLICWTIFTRQISRLTFVVSRSFHTWIYRRAPNFHQRSGANTQDEECSVLLEDLRANSHEPLSPKDSTFPKYGL